MHRFPNFLHPNKFSFLPISQVLSELPSYLEELYLDFWLGFKLTDHMLNIINVTKIYLFSDFTSTECVMHTPYKYIPVSSHTCI